MVCTMLPNSTECCDGLYLNLDTGWRGGMKCPACDSEELERQLSTFASGGPTRLLSVSKRQRRPPAPCFFDTTESEPVPRERSAKTACQVCSTILSSQLPVSRWHEQIGDPTLADGILDRLVHNAHRIEMRGDSMRKNRGKPNA